MVLELILLESFQNVVTTPATSSDYLNSYADITIGNLRTFSGDVHKVKLFTRQQADNTYQNFKFKNMVDDYKVNIIELFENKKLATFPDLINKDIKRRLWKENNVFEEYWIKDDN